MAEQRERPPARAAIDSAVAEVVREAVCRKLTGTATVVISFNQGGVTAVAYGLQDRQRKPA